MIDFYFFKKGSVGVQFPVNRANKESPLPPQKGTLKIVGI